MSLASVEAYLSRPIAPTRRIALGELHLPFDGALGYGGVLLGGIVARYVRELDDDADEALGVLLDRMVEGKRVYQPQMRHRFQADRVGLMKGTYRLEADGERYRFHFDTRVGSPTQHTLVAVYAAHTLRGDARSAAFTAIRKALDWVGPIDERFVRFLADRRSLGASVGADPVGWALAVLPIDLALVGEERSAVIAAEFRKRLIAAHPDHGGDPVEAADRIADLREARRILTAPAPATTPES